MPSASAKLAVANFDAQGLAGTLEGVVRQAALSSAGNAVGAMLSADAWGRLCMLLTACHGVPCCVRCQEPALHGCTCAALGRLEYGRTHLL